MHTKWQKYVNKTVMKVNSTYGNIKKYKNISPGLTFLVLRNSPTRLCSQT